MKILRLNRGCQDLVRANGTNENISSADVLLQGLKHSTIATKVFAKQPIHNTSIFGLEYEEKPLKLLFV